MSMLKWAEKEIEIACKRENPDRKDGEWDYGCACYESALKAYKCLTEDDHSGLSWSLTKNILIRLMDGKPLTHIEDTPDTWNDVSFCYDSNIQMYQCKRMPSLFKHVKDGIILSYSDVDRFVCVDIENPSNTYTFGLVTKLIDELYPIEMPYWPQETWKVDVQEFLVDKENGDFDTVGIFRLHKGDEIVDINRFYKPGPDGKGWTEISLEEYNNRLSKRIDMK